MSENLAPKCKPSGVQLIKYGSVDGAKSVADEIELLTGATIGPEPAPNATVLVHGVFNRALIKAIMNTSNGRVFVMPHGQLARSNLQRSWKKALLGKIFTWIFGLGLVKIVFLNREEHKHSCIGNLSPENFLFIPNYVDGAKLGLPDQRELPDFSMDKKIALVFWGRLDVQHKGLDEFVALACLMSEQVSGIIIIGPEKDEESRLFIGKCKKNFGDRVTYLPFVPRQDIWKTIPQNSVFCLLSRHEGMPLAGLEALYLGLPSIFSRQTNLLEDFEGGVVDGTPGRPIEDIICDLRRIENPESRRENIQKIDLMKLKFSEGFKKLFLLAD